MRQHEHKSSGCTLQSGGPRSNAASLGGRDAKAAFGAAAVHLAAAVLKKLQAGELTCPPGVTRVAIATSWSHRHSPEKAPANTLATARHGEPGEKAVEAGGAGVEPGATLLLSTLLVDLEQTEHLLGGEGVLDDGHVGDVAFKKGGGRGAMDHPLPRVLIARLHIGRGAPHAKNRTGRVGLAEAVEGLNSPVRIAVAEAVAKEGNLDFPCVLAGP
eukprot:UN1845